MNLIDEFSTALARLRAGARRLAGSHCLLCNAGHPRRALCENCEETLPCILRPCVVCALSTGGTGVCAVCLEGPRPYDRTIAAWRYGAPVDRLIRDLKFKARLPLADYFGLRLSEAVESMQGTDHDPPDLIVAVPLSTARLRQRGFNQAHEVARRLRVARHAEYRTDLLQRVRDTPAQVGLSAAARQANLRDAFKVARPVSGRRLALVDDVMTTGATLSEIARMLKHAGAISVDNWVVARAERPADRSRAGTVSRQGPNPSSRQQEDRAACSK